MSTRMSVIPEIVPSPDGPRAELTLPADRRRRRRIRSGLFALLTIGLFAVSSAACAQPGSPRDAINRYFGSEAPYATRIAMCESNMNPRAVSPTHDVGLFQINQVHFDWIRARYGYTVEDLKDPYKNSRVAKYIRDTSGWGAWTCSRKV